MLTLKRVAVAVVTVGIGKSRSTTRPSHHDLMAESGYGIARYKQTQVGQEPPHISEAVSSAAHQRCESDALLDAYGDRSTLAELETAVKAYEAQRRER
jgi:hypothetical protein